MNAVYRNDYSKPAGHGFFLVGGVSPLDSPDGLGFALKRASDRKNLGGAGWQEAESVQTPLAVEQTAEGLALYVGPAVVDHLDVQENYRFSLHAPGKERAVCPLALREVRYSLLAGGRNIASAPPPPQAPEPTPAPAPEPVPEPLLTPESPAPAKRKPPLLLCLALLAPLAAGGGWFFLAGGKTPTPAAQAVTETPLVQARKYLSGRADTADPSVSLRMALEFRDKPEGVDAAFLLAEDAAVKGNAKAMLELAAFYDPLDKRPNGTIRKDPLMAWEWYKKAQTAGETAARAKLTALRAWAESQAPKGSEAAKTILALP